MCFFLLFVAGWNLSVYSLFRCWQCLQVCMESYDFHLCQFASLTSSHSLRILIYINNVNNIIFYVLTCYILCFNVLIVDKIDYILLYMRCSHNFGTFDFEKHGNSPYGSPCDVAASSRRSSQRKMEKSVLRFGLGRVCYSH